MVSEWTNEELERKGKRLKELIPQAIEYSQKFSGSERDRIDIDIIQAIVTLTELRKEWKQRNESSIYSAPDKQ